MCGGGILLLLLTVVAMKGITGFGIGGEGGAVYDVINNIIAKA